MLLVLSNKGKGMQALSEQLLVGKEHCVTTLIMAAKETVFVLVSCITYWFSQMFPQFRIHLNEQFIFQVGPKLRFTFMHMLSKHF